MFLGIFCLAIVRLAAAYDSTWSYECVQSRCVKTELTENNIDKGISLPVCRLFCGEDIGTLWPKPSGPIKLGQLMATINIDKIEFKFPPNNQDHLWDENLKRFMNQINAKVANPNELKKSGKGLIVKIMVDTDDTNLTLETDESYKVLLSQNEEVFAEIRAKTYFGARHGVETLSQLIIYDDIRGELQVVAEAEINDAPAYKHRGVLLDTSRNYYSVASIKRTIDAMAMVKLNSFHWHITDTHSFPLIIKSHPDFAKYGAYSSRQVYTHDDVEDIVKYALIRGVRILPEFDAPAHVGEGWQKKNMTVCFNKQPWHTFCAEPPCGQLDPTVDQLYDVLEDIYSEMFSLFKNSDLFHMGGDEVSISCWNSSETIRNWMLAKGWKLNNKDFMSLWGYFQENALKRVDKASKNKLQAIMWTSDLTDEPYLEQYLDKERYIIQIWTKGTDSKITHILKKGYKVILSNYDALYFDCGNGGWTNTGQNWCSPYIGWQKVYMNSLDDIAGEYHAQVLGAEAAVWSEQIDEQTLDARFWPRASALAERLWSNPKDLWRNAEPRLLLHRSRLVENGISAEPLQPKWCLQNEGDCPSN